MTRKLLLTGVLPVIIGAALAVPVGLALGSAQWGFAAIAFGLCVPTGLLVLLVGGHLIRSSPYGRVLAVFVGTFVRMVVAFGGGLIVFLCAGPVDRSERIAFWLWVLFAYLTTLAIETAVLAGPLGGRGAEVKGETVGSTGHGN